MTPAQRVGVTPKPQPLPLRQSNPTATPAGRRPATPPGRRPAPAAPKDPGKRSAGTIVLLAGLAVLLLGGTAFGLSQVLGGDDPTPPPNTSAPPSGQTPEGGGTNPSVPNEETTVGVLNGTTTNGLAGTIADQLVQEAGYVRGVTATNTRDQTLQASTVYYGQGFRAQAPQRRRAALGSTRSSPSTRRRRRSRPTPTSSSSPGPTRPRSSPVRVPGRR